MAHLLNTTVVQDWGEEFEMDMTNTLCMLAVRSAHLGASLHGDRLDHGSSSLDRLTDERLLQLMHGFANPKIRLDPRLWTRHGIIIGPRSGQADVQHFESIQFRTLARICDFARDVSGHLPEIRATYGVIQSDCAKMAALLAIGPSDQQLSASLQRTRVRQQAAYGILLLLAIMANSALLAYDPQSSTLPLEMEKYVSDVITLARQGLQYRPLGSSSMPVYMVAAWAVTDDAATQNQLEELIVQYQSDFTSVNWLEIALSLKPRRRVYGYHEISG